MSPAENVPSEKPLPLSEVLRNMAYDEKKFTISIQDITTEIKDRTYGAMLLFFALPNLIPLPLPGLSSLMGIPLIFISWQLLLGYVHPWLPKVILNRAFTRTDFANVINRTYPYLSKVEKLLKPRLPIFTRLGFERFVGLLCLVLAFFVMLPIPLTNFIPAIVIAIFALALLAKDGLVLLLGIAASSVTLVFMYSIMIVALKTAVFFFQNIISRDLL